MNLLLNLLKLKRNLILKEVILFKRSVLCILVFSSLVALLLIKGNDTDSVKNTKENISNSKSPDSWALDLIQQDKQFSFKNHHDIKVAVLDSGIDESHNDLKNVVVKEFNAVNPEDPIIDDYGHGTAVAGIIASPNKKIGVLGPTNNIQLHDVKILDHTGKGNINHLIRGIEWSIKNKVHIINISAGVHSSNDKLNELVSEALSQGIIIVASAGNTYGFSVDYPAKIDGVLSINAIDQTQTRPSSAARGKIDYVAPGVNVLSTSKNGGYELFSGTSFATAFATATIIYYLNQYNDLSSPTQDFYQYLNDNGVLNKGMTNKDEYGNGVLVIQ